MDYIEAAVQGKLKLPSIPRVVRTLVSQLGDPDCSLTAVAGELRQDPVLSARVLRLANSPFYAGGRTLVSIDDAVTMIGTRAMRTLVVASGVTGVFIDVPGVNLRFHWLDATVTASAARAIAQIVRVDVRSGTAIDPEAAFLAGLLHTTGHLILCQAFPEAARDAFGETVHLRNVDLAAREMDAFGDSHDAVTAYWMSDMGFPAPLCVAVADYLHLERAEPGSLAPLLRLASDLAANVDAGASAEEAAGSVDAMVLRLLTDDGDRFTDGLVRRYDRLRETAGMM